MRMSHIPADAKVIHAYVPMSGAVISYHVWNVGVKIEIDAPPRIEHQSSSVK